jgi:F-type H+-transporting ATPase subunit beta
MNEANQGAVVSVRGSVVDIRFERHLPAIYSLLRAGKKGRIAIEVLSQLDAHRVRGIALTPTQGLARGMPVEDTGGPLKVPVGPGSLSRMFDVFGNALDREGEVSNVEWLPAENHARSQSPCQLRLPFEWPNNDDATQ